MYSGDNVYLKLFRVTATSNKWTTTIPTEISRYYAELHGDNAISNIATLLTKPVAEEGTPIFTLYNTNYSYAKVNGVTAEEPYLYDDLLDAIKGLDSGEYIIRIELKDLTNHGNLRTDVSLLVMRYATKFSANTPASFTAQWQRNSNNENATALNDPKIAISGIFGTIGANNVFTTEGTIKADDVKYTYGTANQVKWADLKTSSSILGLDAGSYQVVVSIAATNYYEAANVTIQLNV